MNNSITQRNMRNFQVRYHRNDSVQEGFYLCSFIFLAHGREFSMRAVVQENRVMVTSDDINDRWDGEYFREVLQEAIGICEQVSPEKIYGREEQTNV